MRRIRSRHTVPEIDVRALIRSLGFSGYRLHRKDLPGKPDIAFVRNKRAIFVHGCFWHGHNYDEGLRKPRSNRDYWLPKIEGNRRRDTSYELRLAEMAWKVLVVWECELRDTELLAERIMDFLREHRPTPSTK